MIKKFFIFLSGPKKVLLVLLILSVIVGGFFYFLNNKVELVSAIGFEDGYWGDMENNNEIDNITTALGSQHYPIVRMDSDGSPMVVFVSSSVLYFTKWTPDIGWTQMNGSTVPTIYEQISFSGNVSSVRFELDSNDYPYLLWDGSLSNDVYFAKWTVGAGSGVCGSGINDCWTNMAENNLNDAGDNSENVSNSSAVAGGSKMLIGSNDNAYIVFEDTVTDADGDPYFSHGIPGQGWYKMSGTTGKDQLSTNPGMVPFPIDIALDSANTPYVIWGEGPVGPNFDEDVYFSKWTAGQNNWTDLAGTVNGPEKIYDSSYYAATVSIKISSTDQVFVSFDDEAEDADGNTEVYTLKGMAGGSWTNMAGNSSTPDNVSDNETTSSLKQLEINSAGQVYLLFEEYDSGSGGIDDYIVTWISGTGWTGLDGTNATKNVTSLFDGNPKDVRMALDDFNNMYVIWENSHNVNLVRYKSGGWVKMDGTAGIEDVFGANNVEEDSSTPYIDFYRVTPYIVATRLSSEYIMFARWDVPPIDINIDATVDPTISFTLNSTTCALGTLSKDHISTCEYSMSMETNALNGMGVYWLFNTDLQTTTGADIDDFATFYCDLTGPPCPSYPSSEALTIPMSIVDDDLIGFLQTNGFPTITEVEVYAAGISAYDPALTLGDDMEEAAYKQISKADGGYPARKILYSSAPIETQTATMRHGAWITNLTPAGFYSHVVTYTAVGNF